LVTFFRASLDASCGLWDSILAPKDSSQTGQDRTRKTSGIVCYIIEQHEWWLLDFNLYNLAFSSLANCIQNWIQD